MGVFKFLHFGRILALFSTCSLNHLEHYTCSLVFYLLDQLYRPASNVQPFCFVGIFFLLSCLSCFLHFCPAFNVQPFGFAGIICTWYFYCCMSEFLPCFQCAAFRLCGHYLCLVFFIVVWIPALLSTCSLSVSRASSVPGIFIVVWIPALPSTCSLFGFAGITCTWYFYCCMNTCPAFNVKPFGFVGIICAWYFSLLSYNFSPCFERGFAGFFLSLYGIHVFYDFIPCIFTPSLWLCRYPPSLVLIVVWILVLSSTASKISVSFIFVAYHVLFYLQFSHFCDFTIYYPISSVCYTFSLFPHIPRPFSNVLKC